MKGMTDHDDLSAARGIVHALLLTVDAAVVGWLIVLIARML